MHRALGCLAPEHSLACAPRAGRKPPRNARLVASLRGRVLRVQLPAIFEEKDIMVRVHYRLRVQSSHCDVLLCTRTRMGLALVSM